MKTKVQKWGNSQGVRLPKSTLRDMGISVGEEVEILLDMGNIIIKPSVTKRIKISLSVLVKNMPEVYLPNEFSWGSPQGKEVW